MVINSANADDLASIVNSSSDHIFIFDGEGIILDYLENESTQWLYMPREQFIGRHHRDVLPGDLSEKIGEAISQIRNGITTTSFDYSLLRNGGVMWFTAILSPLRKDREGTTRYLCVNRDITERKEKELVLQGVLDNAFNSFIVFREIRDRQGRVADFAWVMVNRQGEQFIGKSFKELQHTTVREIFDQVWILFEEYVEVAETGRTLDLEYSIFKDQSKVWLHTHVSKVEDRLIVTIQDITERKQIELTLHGAVEQLRVSRQAMDLFFSQALSGFYFMMLDKPLQWGDTIDKEAALDYAMDHLRFTRVNQALLEQYGSTEEEFLKLSLKDFFRNDIENARTLLRQMYDAGRIMMDRHSKRFDGSDLWLEGNYICFTDESNRILGHFGIQQDVTDRKHAEEALRASEERYRLLANNMLDLVALHEPDGTYKYLSPSISKILGYTPEELIGTNPYRLFHPEDIVAIQEQSHRQAKEGKEVPNMEYRIRKKDGQYVWFSTNTKPILNREGHVIMLQTVSREVTERIQTLHVLEELNHQKNKLFSIIAHDLRGPLASCMSLLTLTQNAPSNESLEKYLRLARKSAFNLHELMEDLLLWAGSQLDKIAFDPAILNVRDEIESVSKRFVEMANTKGITLIIEVEDSISIFADRDMFHTIIRNLLSNAIKFTPAGGKVVAQATPKNGLVEISVADTGVGIKKEDLDKLFNKTSTFTTYGTGGEKGTGLGLDICKDFVDKHKGKIWVESVAGKGSRFTFTFHEF